MGQERRSMAQSPLPSDQDPQQRVERLAKSFVRFGAALGAGMAVFVERVTPTVRRIYAALWDGYRRAGTPYGDTPEGFMRWVQEQAEVAASTARRARRALRIRPPRPPRQDGAG
jgi:hypothetical protein